MRNPSTGSWGLTSHSFCGRLCPVSHSPTSFPSPGPMWLANGSKTVLKGDSVCACRRTRLHANQSRTLSLQRLEFHVDPDRKFKDPVLEDTAIAEAQVAASEDPPTPMGGTVHPRAALTLPNCSKYCLTSSTTVFADNPPTNIFFVLVTICKR